MRSSQCGEESHIPREQLAEAAQVHQSVRQYLKEVEEPVHEQDQVSTTDPDSTYATSDGELVPHRRDRRKSPQGRVS